MTDALTPATPTPGSWRAAAHTLASRTTYTASPWHTPLALTARHTLVPRWWEPGDDGTWLLRDGTHDPATWHAAYRDAPLVTEVAGRHADSADPGARAEGAPTAWSARPSYAVRMLRHACLTDGDRLLHMGTGSGYGAALAAHRLDPGLVVSAHPDARRADAVRERLTAQGLDPHVLALDATRDALPGGGFDRIVATTGVRPIPGTWVRALRPGGRLVAPIAGTTLILTADKQDDGTCVGRVEWDPADLPPMSGSVPEPPDLAAENTERHISPYAVLDLANAPDLAAALELTAPGTRHGYRETPGGHRTAWLTSLDGSWAHATATGPAHATVHQHGPRHLWTLLDSLRHTWLTTGRLPPRGAHAVLLPDGSCHLMRDGWEMTL